MLNPNTGWMAPMQVLTSDGHFCVRTTYGALAQLGIRPVSGICRVDQQSIADMVCNDIEHPLFRVNIFDPNLSAELKFRKHFSPFPIVTDDHWPYNVQANILNQGQNEESDQDKDDHRSSSSQLEKQRARMPSPQGQEEMDPNYKPDQS